MFIKFEEAEERARDFLGPSAELSYCGINAWPGFEARSYAGEYYVFQYDFAGEYRIGSDRYIGISNEDDRSAVLIAFGE